MNINSILILISPVKVLTGYKFSNVYYLSANLGLLRDYKKTTGVPVPHTVFPIFL